MGFRWIDFVVVGAYLIAITLFGARFGKRQRTLHDYFLGGRRLPWWAIAFSVVSAETSILTIISTPGIAYSTNLNFLQLVFGYVVARFVVAVILIPRYFAGEIYTAYQLIEQRFGRGLRTLTAALFLVTRALAEGVRVFAISIVVGVILKTGVLPSVLIITALTLYYTYRGGLTAVIWTDVIQLFIYVSGTAVALGLAVSRIPGGWPEVLNLATLGGDKLALFNFHFDWHVPYQFWSGLIGGLFLSCASHGTDQLIVQRLLAARSMRESQKAIIASGVIVLAQFALFLFAGIVLFAFYQHNPPAEPFTRPDQIFPRFVASQLPTGLAGLVVAAILAAAMANLSAAFNSLASSSVVDFYKPFLRPATDEGHYLRVSRLLTLMWGGVLIGIALLAQQLHTSVLELALTIASVPYGCMLGIFLLGVLTRRTSGGAAVLGAAAGLAVLLAVMGLTSVAWTWYVAIGTCATFFVGLAVSYLFPGRGIKPADCG
ncbi:MAG: sodium:solute symporter [Terriglobia bacterium]